ncbi:hypothetical protein QUH73_20580 [Labilibaculum sp. K2S]|uniref:hypothetical protein n=1 Tax=Labilibaculum sp. K2S TaxID=3056386 RepID=UPI0025A3E9D6|nr:hypothetical protein [Labilibaculum sp. K2S]MDM8162222.1 hypothetical protein [Labilibaculum sp. K2S]
MGTIYNADGSMVSEVIDAWFDSGYNAAGVPLDKFMNLISEDGKPIQMSMYTATTENGKTVLTHFMYDYEVPTVKVAQSGGGAMETIYSITNTLNDFNPIANFWDVLAYAFTGKDRSGNDMSLGQGMLKALAVVPVGKVGNISVKTLQLTGKVRTAEQGLLLGERFLGNGYSEIAPGVFRSVDGLRQFRMTNSDLLGRGFNDIAHIHFERYYPFNLNTPYVNWHVPLSNP